jgi:hypothetical protein
MPVTSALRYRIDWLTDYDGVKMTSQNRGRLWPIVRPLGDCEWRAVMMMTPAGDNSWLVYQISLVVLPAETSGASRRNGRMNENFAYSVSLIRKRIFTYRKILRHWTCGFTSHPKEGVLRIFIALKNPSPRPDLNPRPLSLVASTLTTTPSRRPRCRIIKLSCSITPCRLQVGEEVGSSSFLSFAPAGDRSPVVKSVVRQYTD